MKVDYALLAERVTRAPDGKLSAHGIFSGIECPGLPTFLETFAVIFRFKTTKEEDKSRHEYAFKVVDEDGNVLGGKGGTFGVVSLGTEADMVESFKEMPQVIFNHAGPYHIDIEVDGRRLHRIPLQVTLQDKAHQI